MARPVYLLDDFPLALDPACHFLEVRCRVEPPAGESRRLWMTLNRLRVTTDTFPFRLDLSAVHYFGTHEDPLRCLFILVYDQSGFLRYRLTRDADGEWGAVQVPEERTGRPVLKPSVRLTFETLEQAQLFLRLAECLRQGGDAVGAGGQLQELLRRVREPIGLVPRAVGQTAPAAK